MTSTPEGTTTMTDHDADLEAGPPTSEPPTEWPADLPDPPQASPEGDSDDDEHHVDPDLLELYEVLAFADPDKLAQVGDDQEGEA